MDLQQIQARLHQQLEQLQDRLSKVMADLSQPHSADSEEQARTRESTIIEQTETGYNPE